MTGRRLRSPEGAALLWVAAYLLVGVMVSVASPGRGPSPWYPPTAIGIATLVLFGRRLLPWLVTVEFIVSFVQFGALWPAAGSTLATVLEMVCTVALLGRWRLDRRLGRPEDALRLVAAAVAASAVASVVGVAAVRPTMLDAQPAWEMARVWFVGDITGILVLLPVLLLVAGDPARIGHLLGPPRRAPTWELALVTVTAATLVVATFVDFDGGRSVHLDATTAGTAVLCLIPVLWAAIRFGRHRTAVLTLGVNLLALAVLGRAMRFDAGADPLALTSAQTVVMVLSLAGLLVATAVDAETAARARQRAILDSSPAAIVALDGDRRVEVWSRAAERIFGWRAEEVVGHPAPLQAEDRPGADWFEPREGEATVRLRGRDGVAVDTRLSTAALLDPDGEEVGVVAVVDDISEALAVDRERALAESDLAVERADRRIVDRVLASVRRGSTPEETAEDLCRAAVTVHGIDWAMVLRAAGDGTIVPLAGNVPAAFDPARPVRPEVAERLRTMSAAGRWTERWIHGGWGDGPVGRALSSSGMTALGGSVVRWEGRTVGWLVCGSADPGGEAAMRGRAAAIGQLATHAAALLGPQLSTVEDRERIRDRLSVVIARRRFRSVFQPIIDLQSGVTVGYEALTRFADGVRPDLVFAEAHRVGLSDELELATLRSSIDALDRLPGDPWMSVNVSPATVLGGGLGGLIAGSADRLVVEVTEHDEVGDYGELRAALDELAPARIAVDDAGSGYASLRHILELRPDVVKLDIGLIAGIDADPARQAIVAGMHYFARETKTTLLGEGIETAEEAAVLRELGVELGQGYLFGRPGELAGSRPGSPVE